MSGSQFIKRKMRAGECYLKDENSLKSLALAGVRYYMLTMSISPLPPYLLLFTVISGGLIYMHGIPPFLFWHPFSLQR